MRRFLVLITIVSTSTLLGCSETSGDMPSFQKAEGYPCLDQVIDQEYLVRFRDGSVAVVNFANDEDFLANYFEPNKHLIKNAEPNYRVSVDQSRMETAVFDNWGSTSVRADSFWSKGIRGENVIVAVIDTGADLNHIQLRNQIFENAGEMGVDSNGFDKRFNGKDDDGNGYADDWKGYDFFNSMPLGGDHKDHGTHVSGIILAEHNDMVAGSSSQVQGVAPKARLLPVAFLGPNGSGSIEGAIKAIAYSASQGAKVINASWGGTGCSVTLREEVRALAEKNVLFVAAAGNRGRDLNTFPEYPASFEGLSQITVGSIDFNLVRSDFSNFSQRFVHLFAPGGGITSTVPNDGYMAFSGTSMAAPFVSGAAALLLSQNPGLSAIDLKAKLLKMVETSVSYSSLTSGRLVLNAD